jgi:hypothetical protein
MAKGTYDSAAGLNKTAMGANALHEGNAGQLFNFLAPQYEQEAVNPQGFGSADLGSMNTAVQQSTGGATAGAVGQNALTSQRTRNLGGMQASNNDSANEAAKINSQKARDIQSANAGLKQQQKQSGLAGLAGLHGGELDTAMKALGIGNSALGTENQATSDYNQAGQSGWLQNTLGILNSLGSLGQGAGAMGAKVCWIAEALWGESDQRTFLVRSWLNHEYARSHAGRLTLPIYRLFGRKIAEAVIRNKIFRYAMQPIFNAALKRARRWAR